MDVALFLRVVEVVVLPRVVRDLHHVKALQRIQKLLEVVLASTFESVAGTKAQLRPLPQRLKGQPNTIELWLPPKSLPRR